MKCLARQRWSGYHSREEIKIYREKDTYKRGTDRKSIVLVRRHSAAAQQTDLTSFTYVTFDSFVSSLSLLTLLFGKPHWPSVVGTHTHKHTHGWGSTQQIVCTLGKRNFPLPGYSSWSSFSSLFLLVSYYMFAYWLSIISYTFSTCLLIEERGIRFYPRFFLWPYTWSGRIQHGRRFYKQLHSTYSIC